MIVKIHETKEGSVVCVVDKDLIDKLFEEDGLQLDLKSNFYKGEEKPIDEIGDLMRNAYALNIVGERTIKLAIEEGIVDESVVKKIANIPYYQGKVLE